MAKFVVLNKKQVGEKDLKKRPQCFIGGSEKFAGDIVELDPASNDARELIVRGLVEAHDAKAKSAVDEILNNK